MGEEIGRERFGSEDFERFGRRLREETDLLRDWFAHRRFSGSGFVLGFELEAWILDHNYFPSPVNEPLLARLDHPLVVPELSRFNVEFNCTPEPLRAGAFLRAERELSAIWAHCNAVAHEMDANLVAIGTLPTIRDEDLSLANISPMKRYHALNDEVLRRRGGKPIRVEIEGRERLVTEHRDVMMEAATTSFQVHLKVPAALAHRYYNASLMASGPVLAASGNAPFLFGRSLWDETRIPLFEQAVELDDPPGPHRRVTFGRGYLESSLHECLAQNADDYPVLLPLCFDDPPEAMRHLRLQNGTIWRWNRPLLGFEADGQPHLRIEHRILPAGPSFLDMMANAAFYVGLVRALVDARADERGDLAFEVARENFYAAAREGLHARLAWPGTAGAPARELLLAELLPAARAGLAASGIGAEEIERYLGTVEERVRSGQTGAAWQRACLDAVRGDTARMMATYCERQRSGAPVSQWDL